jgi:hypothetical protein
MSMPMKKNTKLALPVKSERNNTALKPLSAVDFLVTILFLLIAVFSINLFRSDLLKTINLRNIEPVGSVVIRKNIVQRRLAERVLWDRLAAESPVYLGDLIRVAELSAATLYIEGSRIELSENTLIRLTRAPDNESLQIIMDEGNLSIATFQDSGRISLDVNGRQIQVASTAVLNVTSAKDIVILQINEGTVQFIEDGQTREIQAGNKITVENGFVQEGKSAVVLNPVPNAHYINGSLNPFTISFSWNRINFSADESLRLEIASDRNFNRIYYTHETLDGQAQAVLENGFWYWRLSHENSVLDEGRFTIIPGAGTRLQSPAVSSIYSFIDELPVLNFHWDEVAEASSYILEVCNTPYFLNPQIQKESQITFIKNSDLEEGTWYWRVKPLFPAVYIGYSSFSKVSHFCIEPAIIEPEAEELSLEQWFVTEIPPELTQVLPTAMPILFLIAPAQRTRIEGLIALRQQTVFIWECEAEITSSRFVLSRNPDPFQRQPLIEIQNPERNISVNRLDEGTYLLEC